MALGKGLVVRLLIIEDNKKLSRAIALSLEESFLVDCAYDGEEGLYLAQSNAYDIVLLDVMLPGIDGFGVLEELRKRGNATPVLMLTARGALDDRLRGLRAGADDYLVKPFYRDELLARIEAVLRRSVPRPALNEMRFRELVLDLDKRLARVGDEPVELKGRQFDVLECLMANEGRLISKASLFDKVWGIMSDTSSNVVEVYISAVRRALESTGYDSYIHTIRGAGYLFGERDA